MTLIFADGKKNISDCYVEIKVKKKRSREFLYRLDSLLLVALVFHILVQELCKFLMDEDPHLVENAGCVQNCEAFLLHLVAALKSQELCQEVNIKLPRLCVTSWIPENSHLMASDHHNLSPGPAHLLRNINRESNERSCDLSFFHLTNTRIALRKHNLVCFTEAQLLQSLFTFLF